MSAVMQTAETPKDAARRLAAGAIREGFQPDALHEYRDADDVSIYWRIRCKRADGEKWIRPMHWNGAAYVMGEPSFPNGKPLYRLPDLAKADSVFVVEGEACADALAMLGLSATTSGSASSADAADWTPLRGRSVTIWPDADKPGEKYAVEVADKLRALGCKVRIVDNAALHLAEHGDAVDWLAAHPNATAADVRALATVEDSQVSQVSQHVAAPEPLRRPVPPPEPYPVAELGPILQPACESLRRVIQAPDAVCGSSLLAAASLATQGLANVELDGRTIPLSLWMLTVAESGERKSAVDAEAMRAVRDVEKELVKTHDAERIVFDAALEQWRAQREHAKGEAKKRGGAGLANALQELGKPPQPPLLPMLTVADFTAEGLAKMLAAGRPSVGAFTDEAALVFGGHGMTKETITRTAGTLSKLWDAGTLDRIRSTDGAVKLYGRRLAMHLLAQPVIAERALSDDVLAGQGFLARCLIAWPESTAGTRHYVAESLRDDPALVQFNRAMSHLLRIDLPLAEGSRNELAPRALRLTAEAKDAWRAVHDAIERQQTPSGKYTTCKAWASKSAEQVLRIAGVLTLLESPTANTIAAATIERAAELALWHLDEAARLAGTAELSPEVRDAEALLNWCHETGRQLLCSNDALRKGPNRIRERDKFLRAMEVLSDAGWSRPIDGGAAIGGQHYRNVWHIVGKES